MTKNENTVEFRVEQLESRDAPKTGNVLCGGAEGPSIAADWGEFKQANDGEMALGQALTGLS